MRISYKDCKPLYAILLYDSDKEVWHDPTGMADKWVKWIRSGLKKPGKNQTGLGKALGVAQPQVSRMLKGERQIHANEVPKIARYLGETPPDYLARTTEIRGYVGAGQEIYPVEAENLGEVDVPPTANGSVEAVLVRGDSMYSAYQDGDVILYEVRDHDLSQLVGRRVVAKLADGRTFVKILRRGSSSDLWTLESLNASPIENVAVEWAAPVRWVEHR